jgi:hypothetical protein
LLTPLLTLKELRFLTNSPRLCYPSAALELVLDLVLDLVLV